MVDVIIYTHEGCSYSRRAVSLLDELNIAYQAISVMADPSKRDEMQQRGGGHTTPQIFINGQAIGGCDDLFALHQQGKLEQLLSD